MSSPDTNPFGGKNPHGLYVPMSDDEQEVLLRLVESQSLVVHVFDTDKTVTPTRVGFGDKRVRVDFRVDFFAPEAPTPLPELDIELRTSSGIRLIRKPYPLYGASGDAIQVCEGMYLDLVWDIAIDHMDPLLVKALKPGARGLTSRRLDRDTGDRTAAGNMSLDADLQKMIRRLDDAEKEARKR